MPENDPQQPEAPDSVVKITINSKIKWVSPGSATAARIKVAGEIPKEDQLCQVKDGAIIPLADDQVVQIKGDEEFVSHPHSGGAS